jgi:hypothetical protein
VIIEKVDDMKNANRFIIFMVIVMILAIYLTVRDELKWRDFVADHHCVLLYQEEDHYITVPISNPDGTVGLVTQVVSGDQHFSCDNGNYVR